MTKAETSGKKKSSRKKARVRPKKKAFTQTVFRDWCKACGICIAFCPRSVIGKDDSGTPQFLRPEDCIGCRFCELHCPDFAISIRERDDDQEEAAS